MKTIVFIGMALISVLMPIKIQAQISTYICDDILVESPYTVHDAIREAAEIYQNFDDDMLRHIACQYFDAPWRGSFISGYGIYAMARAAIRYRNQVSGNTEYYIDHIFEDIRLNPDSSLSLTCDGLGDSCAEEYMGRALAFAAHNAWYGNNDQDRNMLDNVNEAFAMITWTSSPGQYSFLEYMYYGFSPESSKDSDEAGYSEVYKDGDEVGYSEVYRDVGYRAAMLFNHQTESPVYGMLTVGHLNHIRRIYEAAGLTPPDFSNLSPNVKKIMRWIRTKIDPSTFLFKNAACGHVSNPWEGVCNCSDRPEVGTGGVSCNQGGIERHPHHYPMLDILNYLGIGTFYQWPWNSEIPPFVLQNCSEDQGNHNWAFNCLFSYNGS